MPKTSTLIGCTLWCIAAGDTAACYSSLVKYQIYPFKAVKKKKKKDSHKCDNDPLRTFFFIWDQTIIWLQCSSLGLAFNTHTHTHAHTHTHSHTNLVEAMCLQNSKCPVAGGNNKCFLLWEGLCQIGILTFQSQWRKHEPQLLKQDVWKPINIININTSEVFYRVWKGHDKNSFVLKLNALA